MALYAFEDKVLIYAGNADERRTYRCSHCQKPVRARRGLHRVPHFYHLRASPSCRLYSKSEDHLVAQLYIRSLLPPGEATIEQPFFELLRVADVIWESKKIIFEIQCSPLTPYEAEKRTDDYRRVGYQLVWILDDKYYNKRHVKPAEALVRAAPCYYATLRSQPSPRIYDQFEVIAQERRIHRGQRLCVHLACPCPIPLQPLEEKEVPKQILNRSKTIFFKGDLLYRALIAQNEPIVSFAIQNLRALEILFQGRVKRETSRWRRAILFFILEPYGHMMRFLLERAARRY